MRHHKIQKSKRHKKLKSIETPKEFNFIKDQLIDKIKEQPIPRKLADLMKSKNQNPKINKNEANKKKKEKRFKQKHNVLTVKSESTVIEKGMTRVPKPLPEKVEKGLTESDSHFMGRLNRLVSKAMAEANLEDHFDVDLGKKVENNDDNDMDDIHQSHDTKIKNAEKKKDKRKLKDLKRKAKKLKKQHRLVKQLEKSDEFIFKKDTIEFGELVHQPPSFHYKTAKK